MLSFYTAKLFQAHSIYMQMAISPYLCLQIIHLIFWEATEYHMAYSI